MGTEAGSLPGFCRLLGPLPLLWEFQALHLREALEQVVADECLFSASRLKWRPESALCPTLCTGKAWFPSGPAPLQPHATPRNSFDFESLNMYLGDRWWKLITSCVLTEF